MARWRREKNPPAFFDPPASLSILAGGGGVVAIRQVCLGCGTLTANGARCEACASRREAARAQRRSHYRGDYKRRAAAVRRAANADPSVRCWLCGELARGDDPWTADHVDAGNEDSPLMPAHASCNSRRGDMTADEYRRKYVDRVTNSPSYGQ